MSRHHRLALLAIFTAAIAVRLFVLFRGGGPILDADEAVVGLMARHIAGGRAFPLYYYGQNYLGALEAWCAAAVFAVVGPSATALRAVPFAFSLVALFLVYRLGERCYGVRAGLLAALLFAVPPSGLAIWSLKARGGFIELVAIGTGVLVAAESLFFRGGDRRTAFALGALLGLGWWVNQQILYYALPVAAWAALRNRDDPMLGDLLVPGGVVLLLVGYAAAIPRPDSANGRLALAAALLGLGTAGSAWLHRRSAARAVWALPFVAAVAAIADDLPFLHARPGVELASMGGVVLAASVAASRGIDAQGITLVCGTLAVWLAAFRWWNPSATVYAAVALVPWLLAVGRAVRERPRLLAAVVGMTLGAAPFLVGLALRGGRLLEVVRGTPITRVPANVFGFVSESLPMLVGARPFWGDVDFLPGLSLLVVALYGAAIPPFLRSGTRERTAFLGCFLAAVPAIFAASAFGWFRSEPRYLLPIYSVLFVVPAAAADRWAREGRRAMAAASIAALLAVHLYGSAQSSRASDLLLLSATERVSADHRELIRFLEEKRIRHVYTSYWIGYRLAFETAERVVFAPFGQPATERIPSYGREVRRAERVAYVFAPTLARIVTASLDALGVGYARRTASGYEVIYDLERPSAPFLALGPRELGASVSAAEIPLAADGSIDTRWATHSPQAPGTWVEVRLRSPQALAWLSATQGDFTMDYPRGLRVMLETPERTWQVVADSETTPALRFWLQGGRLDVDLAGRRALALRLVLTGRDDTFDWSIAELAVSAAQAGEWTR
ncbi:MAG: hypothetical protein QOD06_1134 [Candidatus Binatota bacterium]|nr:hypothetical protein [Candidatus Binatota bacterium]